MRKDLVPKGRSLGGVTDLTLLAALQPGLVPALEAVTYKTRTKRVLETLGVLRTVSHEYTLLRTLSDAVERVGRIHSVRVAVLEPENKVLLSATFDGAWESYVRVLWQKVGKLLDLIFCNTVDYVPSSKSYDEWAGWVRRVQVEVPFFYGMPGVTVGDVRHLRAVDRLAHRLDDTDDRLAATRYSEPTVEAVTCRNANATSAADPIGPQIELGRQGVQAVAALYRLAPLYRADTASTADAAVLHAAARELVAELLRQQFNSGVQHALRDGEKRFKEALDWVRRPAVERDVPPWPPATKPAPDVMVQGGILQSYDPVTHGCLLLLAWRSPAAAAAFLRTLEVTDDRKTALTENELVRNLALTFEGLRALGVPEATLDTLPQEFREGMAARASTLGDRHGNHPRRWRPPVRNWPPGQALPSGAATQPIGLAAVHAVVQMRIHAPGRAGIEATDAGHPLHASIVDFVGKHGSQVDLLAVESLVRHLNAQGVAEDHFGYADGDSEPTLDPAGTQTRRYPNLMPLGDLLVGCPNRADSAPEVTVDWLRSGSFLVLRKLRMDTGALDAAIDRAAKRTGLDGELLRAKLLGRRLDGMPLADGHGTKNDFRYDADPQGVQCPFHAHIRRANPRTDARPPLDDSCDHLAEPAGGRFPRIVRRSLSYGPKKGGDDTERGLMFMTYNASIAQQFEVVQGWLAGGNSTGGDSAQSDPLAGVPEPGRRRTFRFEHAGQAHVIELDGVAQASADAQPLVRLEWGLYLFTPSIPALATLAAIAQGAASRPQCPWNAERGRELIAAIEALPQGEAQKVAWKVLLEDADAQDSLDAASVWAAIRQRKDRRLQTPFGLLVAGADEVARAFADPGLSVAGYAQRMQGSIGPIHLGLDAGTEYDRLSGATNRAIRDLSARRGVVFEHARAAAAAEIEGQVEAEVDRMERLGRPRWELVLGVKEISDKALEVLCERWFGMRSGGENEELVEGAYSWDWRRGDPPSYPGHFTLPSRHIFQPHPTPTVERRGSAAGAALTEAMTAFVARIRAGAAPKLPLAPDGTPAPVAKAIFEDAKLRDDEERARAMVGAMMGFLPTVDGMLQSVIDQWLRRDELASLRARLGASSQPQPFDRATAVLVDALTRAMQWRPVPAMVWRWPAEAAAAAGYAAQEIADEDKVVLSVVSALHQRLGEGAADLSAAFGHGLARAAPAPTHACPGYAAAMEVLLGIASAILEAPYAMRPAAGRLTLQFEGDVKAHPAAAMRFPSLRTGAPRAANKGWLLAEGDSWFAPFFSILHTAPSMLTALKALGYEPESIAKAGDTLQAMASPEQGRQFAGKLELMVADGQPPRAVLLSAGGNDFVSDWLEKVVIPRAGNPPPPYIDRPLLDTALETLKGRYEFIVDRMTRTCEAHGLGKLPIFMHGYDHPVPWRRTAAFDFLYHPLAVTLGYTDLDDRKLIMRTLIDRLNGMQARLCGSTGLEHVHHVELTGTLSTGPDFQDHWKDDMHPTQLGYDLLAARFASRMETVFAAQPAPAITPGP